MSINKTDKKTFVSRQIAVRAVECKKIDLPVSVGKRDSVAAQKGGSQKKFSGRQKSGSKQRKQDDYGILGGPDRLLPYPINNGGGKYIRSKGTNKTTWIENKPKAVKKKSKSSPSPAATVPCPVKRSKRLPTKRELRAAGLPPPASCRPNSAEFRQLEAKWDAKLEATGFDDLERTDRPDGKKGRNSDYLKGSAARGRTWSPERAQFYRLLQNYITHHQFTSMQDRWVMHRMNDGGTYREILAECRRKYKLKRSLYWFYYYVQKLVEGMVAWNISHAEGMLNPAAQDKWADDALLSDLSGQAGVIEAPNGLKLDQGWWLENAADWWRNNGGH